MWYLKVSSSLLIAVALICMIQNAISLTVDQTTEDQWSKLASSTDKIDLKKILKVCKNSINSFNEKLENTKTIVKNKLLEPNKTTEDIENLVSDVKTQIKNSSGDLVKVRKLVQNTALRFRNKFKSLASLTELDNESVNKELEGIKKTTVDDKKPLVNRVVRSFGNRYDLNKLANKVLEISADREKLQNNYDEKKKIAKKELNSLWNSLTYHSKTVNDNALKAFETFFEGLKSLKSVKKKVENIGKDAINEIKKGDNFSKIKNAVELAKALKLEFEDEWNLDSRELSYSEEQKKDTTKKMDEKPVEDNKYDNSTNDIEPSLTTPEKETIDKEKINAIPRTQVEIEKPSKDDSLTSDKAVSEVEKTQLPTESENKVQTTKLQPTIQDDLPVDNISDTINPIKETSIIPNMENKENKEKTIMVEPKVSNNKIYPTDGIKSDLSNNETTFNPDIINDETLISPNKNTENTKKNQIVNKRTSREKIPILPWQKLIQLDDPQVSQQSKKCESLLNNITPDFDNIKKSAKNSIQVTKNYKTLQKIENDTVQQFYDKMVDTNKKLSDYLVNSAEDVCAKVTPINKRYKKKFKNDPNIIRIKYLLGTQYDPNHYILKVLEDASSKNGIGGMKKTTYFKMLSLAHNLNHETKEMENVALYAMNKIYEGKLAATNLKKMFNKEKASKACFIKKILLEKENDAEKKNKDKNKKKVKESINNDTNTEPLNPNVNLDSVDIQPSTINDDNEPTLNNEEEKKTLKDTNELTTHNNLDDNKNDYTTDEKDNNKKENEEQKTEEKYNISSIPQNKDSDSTQTTNNPNKQKRNITRKVTHHRKHRNLNDPKDVSEEYDTIEEIDDEEDITNEYKSSENKTNITPKAESLVNSDNKQEVAENKHSENENIESNEESSSHKEITEEGAPEELQTHQNIKQIDPKNGKEISEEYEEEDENKLNKSGEKTIDDTQKTEDPVVADDQDHAEALEHLENENIESNEDNSDLADTSEGDNLGEPKTKRRRKRIDPKNGKEISEEYEEEDENKLNKSGEKTIDDTQKTEDPVVADDQDHAEALEHLENENIESNEDNSDLADTSEGDKLGEPKTKRRRKRIDPKNGKEISEEYEEEDENKLNKSGEKTIDDTQKTEDPVIADDQDHAEALEHLENENIESNEDNSDLADTSEGDNLGEPKTKRRRKRIDPKNGKEISEEYEEEDENKLNKSGEKTIDDTQKTEDPVVADDQDHAEALEHLENENIESNENNSDLADTSEGDNLGEPKTKRRRKRIDPKNGKQISEEYEEEDENKLNKSGEKTIDDTQKTEDPVVADDQDHAEALEHLENENIESNEDNSDLADTSEGDNLGEPKTKRRRKRIDPKNGKEISEEYEEEDENKLNKSGEKTIDDTQKTEDPVVADDQDHAEALEHLENENIESNEDNSDLADTSEGDNLGEPKTKRRRKRIDPKNGKEISEEYEEEDENKLNKSGEKTIDDTQKTEDPVIADDQDHAEALEHLENENIESNEDNSDLADTSEGDNLGEPKTKRRRKRIDPKNGKEISEEYEEEDENKLNKSGEKTIDDTQKTEDPVVADDQDHAEALEHLENENIESNENNSDLADTSEGDNLGEPKTKRRRKRIDPKNGKQISEEYEEEDENKLNKSGEKTIDDTQKTEAPVVADDQDHAEALEHLENENIESNEDNSDLADTSEGDNLGEPKTKRRRKRIDPKDRKDISKENETFEENEKDLNKSREKVATDTPEIKKPVNKENESEQETEEQDTNRDMRSVNEDTTKKRSKELMSLEQNDKEIDQENITNEIKDLDENENINSVEDTELKRVNNDKIIPAAESMGEDSVSYETSYESPEQCHRQKDPRRGIELSEEYDKDKNKNDKSPTGDNESDSPSKTREYIDDEKSSEIPEHDDDLEDIQSNEHEPETTTNDVEDNPSEIDETTGGFNKPSIKNRLRRRPKKPKNGLEVPENNETDEKQDEESPIRDNEIESPSKAREYIDDEQSSEIPEHDDYPEHIQSNEYEPETTTNDVEDTPSVIGDEVDRNNQPNRRHRRRRDPKNGLEVSEEYDTFEEEDEQSPLEDKEIDTPIHNDDIQHIQSNEHEPETTNNDVEDNPSEIDETTGGFNKPSIKNRLRRRPKKPKNGLEVPENNETDEKQDQESPIRDNEIESPSKAREYIDDEQSSEIPEHDDYPEHIQSNEHEPETTTNDVEDTPSVIGEGDRNKKPNRRHRRRRDPKTGLEVSEEYDTFEEEDEESPLEDKEIDTPIHDDDIEHIQSNEHEPETTNNDVEDNPSEIDETTGGFNKPSIKNRLRRRPKKPKNGLEVPENNETDEKQDQESPIRDNEIESPSKAREYIDDEQSSEIPEHDDYPEHIQSNEHEPETTTNDVEDTPSVIGEGDRNKKPNRRHRRRRDPKTGLEVSEEYDTFEEEDEQSPLEDKEIDTPIHNDDIEHIQSNEHEPETTTNDVEDTPSVIDEGDRNKKPNRRHRRRRDPKTGLEVSEEYDTFEEEDEQSPLEDKEIDTPIHDDDIEHIQSNEHEPETTNNDVEDNPSEIDETTGGFNKPSIKNRLRRRPKKPKNGLEVPENNETDEKQDQESPIRDNEIESPSKAREYIDDEQSSEIPEHDDYPEHIQSNEHEPETTTNDVEDTPSVIGDEVDRNNQPNRRHRRRRDPKNGLEVSEEYDTFEEEDEQSPLEDKEIDTPIHNDDIEHIQSNEHEPETPTNDVEDTPSVIGEGDRNKKPNRRHRRRRDPKTGLEVSEEYDTFEEEDEESPLEDKEIDTPIHDDDIEHIQSNEHEPETTNNDVEDNPSEIDETTGGFNKPSIKNRLRRRPKKPKNGLEVPENNETDEKQDQESPIRDNEIESPSKAREYIDDEQSSEIPEHDDYPEHIQSNEHEPETTTNDVEDTPSVIGEGDRNKKPNRRHRRRRDPKTGLEVSEEYDTFEEEDEESPLEDKEIDTPIHDDDIEHIQSNEHEPETTNNDVEDNPSEIDETTGGFNKPSIKNRLRRRPKKPKNGLEVPENNETDEKQDQESPIRDNEIESPSKAREYIDDEQSSEIPEHDDYPEHIQSNEHEPETTTNDVEDTPSVIGEGDRNKKPNRRHRRRRDPKTGLEVSEEYDTFEEEDEESPLDDKEIDTPIYDDDIQHIQSNEYEPETTTNDVEDTPSVIGEGDRNKKPNRRHRRRRDPKTGLEVSEEYDTFEEEDEESPLEDKEIDTQIHDDDIEHIQSNEHEPETTNNDVEDNPSEIDETTGGFNKPSIKNRLRRRPKKPKNGLEVPENNETDEKQDQESPIRDNEIESPSKAREYIDDEQSSEIPEHDDYPEHIQSNEHEPETTTNDVEDTPSVIGDEVDRNNQPNRRHRRRRDPKNGLEVSEEYDTFEEEDEQSPLEDKEIDTPIHNDDIEHIQSNEHEPETPTNDVEDTPSVIGEGDRNKKPNRRHRRRRDPKTGLEVSEEYDTFEEEDEESPLEDKEIDTPIHDDDIEHIQSNEHEPETTNNDVEDNPSEIDETTGGFNKPSIKNRLRRRPKKPKNGLEVPENNETDEKQDQESPIRDNEIESPSKAREYIDDEQSSEIPEHDDYPEHIQSNEHEPETTTNDVEDTPSVIGEGDRNKKPNRRHRRRRDPKTGLEVSEEYDTFEEEDEESPLEDKEIDTPIHDDDIEHIQSNEHEPETTNNDVEDNPSEIDETTGGFNKPSIKNRRRRRPKKPKNGLEVPENNETDEKQDQESPIRDNEIESPSKAREYIDDEQSSEIPEHDDYPEHIQSNEHEPETTTNDVEDTPSVIGDEVDRNNQPNRRHRRRRDPKNGLEVSEEYDTFEEEDEQSPLEDKEIDTPIHNDDIEHIQSNEHEPETPTNDVEDTPSVIGEGDRNKKPNRRHRRRRDPKTGLEVSEEYDTFEEEDEESPLEDKEIDTPIHDDDIEHIQSNEHEPETTNNDVEDNPSEIDETTGGFNKPSIKNRLRRRPKKPKNGFEVPENNETDEKQDQESPIRDNEIESPSKAREYIDDEQSSEIPEHDDYPEHIQSNEYEPETTTNDVEDTPSVIGDEVDRNNQPNRRHRRRRDPKNGLEVSEEYDTFEEEDEQSPLEDKEIDTPIHNDDIEHIQSNEHEPETPTNDVENTPSVIGEGDRNKKPNRRHRRRRDPKTGLEVSEEYDTFEEEDEQSPLEDKEIDTPIHDDDIERIQSNEHEPETTNNDVEDNPSKIDETTGGFNKPSIKNRRRRRPKKPKNGLEVPENNETDEKQDEESPIRDNEIESPSKAREYIDDEQSSEIPEHDDYPEHIQSNEYEPETTTNDVEDTPSVIGDEVDRNNQPNRRHRRRRDPKTGLEVSEEYDAFEEEDEESPLEDKEIDTPENDEKPLYNQSNDVENNAEQPELSEYPENSDLSSMDSPTPIDTDDNDNVIKSHPRKIRRRRKPKPPQSVYGNDKTPKEVNAENINNYPVETQDVNNNYMPYNNNDVNKEIPNNGFDKTNNYENDKNQPEFKDYPDNSDLSSKDSATPIDTYDNENVIKPHPRKIRRRRKPKPPQSVYGNDKTPKEVNAENINNYPVEAQDVNNNYMPYNNNDVNKEIPNNGFDETNNYENDKNQPEFKDYPDNSDLSSKDSATPIDTYDNENVIKPHPHKIRRRRKPKPPQSVYGNDKTPKEVNAENINNYPVEAQDVNNNYMPYNNNDVNKEIPNNGFDETNNYENDKNQPEFKDYPDNSDLSSKDSATPIDTYDNENVIKPHPRKIRRRRKPKPPQSVYGNDKTPKEVNAENINNYPVEAQDVNNNYMPYNNNDVNKEIPNNEFDETNNYENDKNQPEFKDYPDNSDLSSKDSATPIDTYDNENVIKPHPRKIRRRRKPKPPQSVYGNDKTPIKANDVSTKLIPTNVDAENSDIPNKKKSTEISNIDPKNIQKNPKKKRHIRRIRTYVVNKATNERIPINDQTYSTTDGLPDAINNKSDLLETVDFNDRPDSNTDNDDYSSFLFKEYNSDQCKRDAYDRFKKVTSQDAKQIAYRSVLDTSEMRSNMLATIKNAIGNVKASRTFNDVDQSLRTVSYSLKVGLKQTVNDLVIKVIPLANDFLKTAENLKELYQRGPQSTHKMLTNILKNESTVLESAKDILRLISPQFDVDELINNIFEKPCIAKSLKEKKVKAQRKLIDLSKHMDTAISNIDCFVLSAMSTVGIGADTLKLLKSGKVIMSDKHPRAKILRDAVGIIKAGKKIRNNEDNFIPTLTLSDGTTESDEDDDEDPDQVAQKNEEFLKTVPDLDDNISIPKKVPNKRQSLGVIVVHPDKQIEYKEVTNTSQLKKFVGDQTKKYKLQSKNKHPKFLKLNSKQLIDAMVADVKKKAERNGMTKKEMVDEIIKNLNSS